MSLPRPKAIIFDWDNTLVDSWGKITTSINKTMLYMGMPEVSLAQIKNDTQNHLSVKDRFPSLFGERWEEAGKVFYSAYLEDEVLSPIEGAEESIVKFMEKGIPIALLSNKRSPILNAEVDRLGWRKYFASIVGSTDTEFDKPHPAPAIAALKPTKIEPGLHIWFIGDAMADVECARNINSTPILYGDTVEMNIKLEKVKRVFSHKELCALLSDKKYDDN